MDYIYLAGFIEYFFYLSVASLVFSLVVVFIKYIFRLMVSIWG